MLWQGLYAPSKHTFLFFTFYLVQFSFDVFLYSGTPRGLHEFITQFDSIWNSKYSYSFLSFFFTFSILE